MQCGHWKASRTYCKGVEMKKEYQIIVDYVEGRMSAEAFKKELLQNSLLEKELAKWQCKKEALKDYGYNFYEFLIKDWRFNCTNWNNVTIRYYLLWWLEKLLMDTNISFLPCKKYEEDYSFLLDIQPTWLDINDDTIFQQIIDEIPQDLSKSQRIKLGKEKVKALFKYDKTYPRWIQDPEWPIVNGKPLVFSHQEKAKGEDIRTYYYFYDEDTKEEKVIEQFD